MVTRRICKNDNDYYMIQRLKKPLKIFGITILKERWVRGSFSGYGDPMYYKSVEQAEYTIKMFKEIDKRNERNKKLTNNNWKCLEKIY